MRIDCGGKRNRTERERQTETAIQRGGCEATERHCPPTSK